ncbi:MAG TPA: MBL fold metallo-hydrolase [Coriobacteriia bacterium]|jgi:glyoxylase-like metal-dependent hydrolase (beta-lactamase superfamily II)
MRIHRIEGRLASAYLLEGERLFLVDTGFVGHSRKVLRAIRDLGRRALELELVVVTHAHADHFGALSELGEHAEFDVGCHSLSASALAAGTAEVSPGLTPWARAYERLARVSLPLLGLRGAVATVDLSDGLRLHDRGLPGSILHTPGHTTGCISLLLDDGSAFVGDLITGPQGCVRLPAPTTMAADIGRTFAGWRRLLAAGARRFFPAHGDPFSAEELRDGMGELGIPREMG